MCNFWVGEVIENKHIIGSGKKIFSKTWCCWASVSLHRNPVTVLHSQSCRLASTGGFELTLLMPACLKEAEPKTCPGTHRAAGILTKKSFPFNCFWEGLSMMIRMNTKWTQTTAQGKWIDNSQTQQGGSKGSSKQLILAS